MTAKFIVADLTGQRPNCYYEVGFAHALEKEVIHVIHEDHPIRFDIKDYNFIVYRNVAELERRLKERIFGTVGIAQVDADGGAETEGAGSGEGQNGEEVH